jgi:hypothetical protein
MDGMKNAGNECSFAIHDQGHGESIVPRDQELMRKLQAQNAIVLG